MFIVLFVLFSMNQPGLEQSFSQLNSLTSFKYLGDMLSKLKSYYFFWTVELMTPLSVESVTALECTAR